jgi:hypothetical protein
MRKLALLAATCVAALAATGAGAAAPERITIPIQDTFYAPFMSEACGVPVTITIQGTSHVLLQRNDAGLVVREHDVLSSFTAVFESPTGLGGTGRSFTNRSPGVATFDYGAGATIGSTALIDGLGRSPASHRNRRRVLAGGGPDRRLRRPRTRRARHVARVRPRVGTAL